MVVQNVNCMLSKFLSSYEKWLMANPQLMADIESAIRYMSYFTAGRFNNSSLASEFIYSMPNLLVLFNDLMIHSNKYMYLKLPKFEYKIKVWLTILEYTEALLEVSAKKIWGEKGKWIIICVVQTLKSIMRYILVHIFKERITKNPPLPPINRDKLKDVYNNKEKPEKEGFTLKRSGTVVRCIKASNPIQLRTWAPLSKEADENENYTDNKTAKPNLMFAESLYIAKPLLHLICLSMKGYKSWQPWLISLAIDAASLKIVSNETRSITLTKDEKVEIYRRKMCLLLYLLRSPFYDTYSRKKINSILKSISNNIPLAKYIAEPMVKYLPHWQNIYFYMWSC